MFLVAWNFLHHLLCVNHVNDVWDQRWNLRYFGRYSSSDSCKKLEFVALCRLSYRGQRPVSVQKAITHLLSRRRYAAWVSGRLDPQVDSQTHKFLEIERTQSRIATLAVGANLARCVYLSYTWFLRDAVLQSSWLAEKRMTSWGIPLLLIKIHHFASK